MRVFDFIETQLSFGISESRDPALMREMSGSSVLVPLGSSG
jgi:hypothetical protein